MSFCEVNRHQIQYEALNWGKRDKQLPMLVFLHEGLGSIAQWKDFPSEISGKLGLPALVYDRYGYGGSCILQEKRTSDFLRTEGPGELTSLLGVLGIDEQLVLIGHSDGGTISLYFASRFPHRVKAVITEAAHVLLEDISHKGIRESISLFRDGRLKELLKRYHGERTDSMFYGWAETWISGDLDDWNMKNDLTLITSPVLAIQGVDDQFGSRQQLDWIVKYCSGPVETFMVDNCAHIPHFQQRELVSERIIAFIKKTCLILYGLR